MNAIGVLQKNGNPAKFGDDFGGDEETIISEEFDRPVLIHHYRRNESFLHAARCQRRTGAGFRYDRPEGYGEIIGGSQRITIRFAAEALARSTICRRVFSVVSGFATLCSVPHSGFGMAWSARGLDLRDGAHREVIPSPRMIYRYTLDFANAASVTRDL